MDYFENESGLDPAEIAQASPQGHRRGSSKQTPVRD
jgi:hypothetical protein